jgi:hypothetical protein
MIQILNVAGPGSNSVGKTTKNLNNKIENERPSKASNQSITKWNYTLISGFSFLLYPKELTLGV